MANNGYLEKDRLAHVIAAIQVMAVAKEPSGDLNRWIIELDAGEASPDGRRERISVNYAARRKWTAVFEEHPEFFKLYTMKGEPQAALRMRLALAGGGDFFETEVGDDVPGSTALATSGGVEASPAKPVATAKRTRPVASAVAPLADGQIGVLIKTAIDLHSLNAGEARAPERGRGRRWLFSAAGAVVGSIVGGSLVAFLVWSPAAIHIFH
jgi:hypothetical protein